MILRRLIRLGSALVLSASALLTIATVGVVHAAGIDDWTGSSSATAGNGSCTLNCWSVAGNWSAGVPATGDDVVFDNTNLGADSVVDNDITGLSLANITFQGSTNYGFTINGNALSLSTGIDADDTLASHVDTISAPLTVTASSFLIDNTSPELDITGLFDDGTYSMGVEGAATTVFSGGLSGSGGILISGGAGVTSNGASPDFSGGIEVSNNSVLVSGSDSNDLGTGTVTVDSGSTLSIDMSSASQTISTPLNLAGNGVGGTDTTGAIVACYFVTSACATSEITFSGAVTLAGYTLVENRDFTVGESSPPANTVTFDFTGSVNYTLANYTITTNANSGTVVDLPSTGGGSSGSTGGTTKAPKTPDTGLGFLSSERSSALTIGLTTLSAVALVVIARRYSHLTSKK